MALSPPAVDAVLQWLLETHGFDFRQYKRPSLERRLQQRILLSGASDAWAYLKRLKEEPEEVHRLLATLTIKVSHFFRDPLVFEFLRKRVIPDLIRQKEAAEDRTLRIWSAGCAAGEEAYSMALVMAELVEKKAERLEVFILGTDVDEVALERAREGFYEPESLQEVRKGILDRYFQPVGNGYRIAESIRRMVHFSLYPLTAPTPSPPAGVFATYDLILCRNVLIYFDLSLQEQVVAKFLEALAPGGLLVLGESELLPEAHRGRFHRVTDTCKIFQKTL